MEVDFDVPHSTTSFKCGNSLCMNNPSQDLSITDFHKWWWGTVALVFGFLVVGLLYWKELALSVEPPGFQAMLSFLSLPIGILFCVGLIRIRISYRNKSFVNVLSSWIIALIIATMNLVLYSWLGTCLAMGSRKH